MSYTGGGTNRVPWPQRAGAAAWRTPAVCRAQPGLPYVFLTASFKGSYEAPLEVGNQIHSWEAVAL